MQPEQDHVRIAHMHDAATRAVAFSLGRSREDLDHDDMLVLALMKLVEIVGEAAKHVGAETRNRFPGVPWSDAARPNVTPRLVGTDPPPTARTLTFTSLLRL